LKEGRKPSAGPASQGSEKPEEVIPVATLATPAPAVTRYRATSSASSIPNKSEVVDLLRQAKASLEGGDILSTAQRLSKALALLTNSSEIHIAAKSFNLSKTAKADVIEFLRFGKAAIEANDAKVGLERLEFGLDLLCQAAIN
jgi:hypothetical protein